jgi:hypothetical protein
MKDMRALVDWEWGSHGLWYIRSREERESPPPTGGVWGPHAGLGPRPRPWSHVVSIPLLDELQCWNDATGEQARRDSAFLLADDFLVRVTDLASRVQDELGSEWEVLYAARGGWHWVRLPRRWLHS